LLAEQAAILADSPLPATALVMERDVTVRARDATASVMLALAEDKRRKEEKRCLEEAAAKKQCQAGVNLHLFSLAYSYE
jgi:hypothetical protein